MDIHAYIRTFKASSSQLKMNSPPKNKTKYFRLRRYTLLKILSVFMLAVFLKGWAILVIVGIIVILVLLPLLTLRITGSPVAVISCLVNLGISNKPGSAYCSAG